MRTSTLFEKTLHNVHALFQLQAVSRSLFGFVVGAKLAVLNEEGQPETVKYRNLVPLLPNKAKNNGRKFWTNQTDRIVKSTIGNLGR